MIGVCILNLSFKITGIYQQLPYLFQQLTSPCVYTFDVSLIKSLILGMMKISSDIFCIILVFNIIPMIFRLSVFLCAGRDSLDIFLVFLNSGNRINDKKNSCVLFNRFHRGCIKTIYLTFNDHFKLIETLPDLMELIR